jgi:hypothetical protein
VRGSRTVLSIPSAFRVTTIAEDVRRIRLALAVGAAVFASFCGIAMAARMRTFSGMLGHAVTPSYWNDRADLWSVSKWRQYTAMCTLSILELKAGDRLTRAHASGAVRAEDTPFAATGVRR